MVFVAGELRVGGLLRGRGILFEVLRRILGSDALGLRLVAVGLADHGGDLAVELIEERDLLQQNLLHAVNFFGHIRLLDQILQILLNRLLLVQAALAVEIKAGAQIRVRLGYLELFDGFDKVSKN